MNDYKFDRFYYSVDDSNEHYLSEIENLSDEEYEQEYKGKMHCPQCKEPQLTLVRGGDSSYLRTYPKQFHKIVDGQMCLYSFKTASKTIMEEYVQELRDKKKIKSALEAVMRCLFKSPTPKHTIPKTGGDSKDALLIEKEQKDKTIKKYIIPHYSFRSWGKNIPQNQLLIVYGKVYIKLKDIEYKDSDGNVKIQTYIQFRDIRTKKIITSCVKPQGINISDGNYYGAVLGCCYEKVSNGYTYYNLRVNFPVDESVLLKPFSPQGMI